MSAGWAQPLRDGYLRLHDRNRTTAPQLKFIIPDHGRKPWQIHARRRLKAHFNAGI